MYRLLPTRRRDLLVVIAGTLLSLALLWLAFRRVNLAEVGASLGSAKVPLLAAALAIFIVTELAKALRWRVLLGKVNRGIGAGKLLSAIVIGQMINALIPVRFGDLARCYVVSSTGRVGGIQALGTIVVEKAVESVMLLLLTLIVATITPLPQWLKASSLGASVAVAAVLVAFLVLSRARVRPPAWSERWIGPQAWLTHVGATGALARLARGIRPMADARSSVVLWLWSVFIWVLMILTNVLVLWSMGIRLPLVASALLLVTLNLGTVLPSAPARLGIYHYVCVLTLQLFGVDSGLALSFAIVLHALVHIPMFMGGAAFLSAQNYSLARLARAAQGAGAPGPESGA